MNIDYLRGDELEYELGARSYPTDGTVAEKRSRLRTALRLEKDGAVFTPASLLDPEEEIRVCQEKFTDLRDAVANFNVSNATNDYKRLRTRLFHLLGRLNRISDSRVSSQKGQLLAKCGEVSDVLEEHVLLLDFRQAPNTSTLEPNIGNHSLASGLNNVAVNRSSETRDNVGRGHQNSSLIDAHPDELQSTINSLQLNCPTQVMATPFTQSIVTTTAGSQAASLAHHPEFYQPFYLPVQPPTSLPPQVPFPVHMPPPTSSTALPPHWNPPVMQSEPFRRWSQEVPMVPNSGRRVNFVPPPIPEHGTSGMQPNNWVQQGDQARVFKTVSQWNIKYDGMSSIINFLDSIEEMRLACGFSKEQLMGVAVVLFGGVALDWYRANINSSHGWNDLVGLLKAAFLPVEYEEDIWTDIRLRTQGQCEGTVVFVAVMQNLFNKLSDKPNEHTRLRIIRRNLLPHIQSQLALCNFSTINELLAACHRIEDAQVRIERFRQPPTNPNLVTEQGLMYNPRRYRATVHSVQSLSGVAIGETESLQTAANPTLMRQNPGSLRVVCWNCRQPGHIKRSCPSPLKKHCFRCGEPGVTKQNCPKCSGNAQVAP